MKIKELAKQMLTQRENQHYEKALQARRGTYAAWLEGREKASGKLLMPGGGAKFDENRISAALTGAEEREKDSDFVIVHVEKGALAVGAEEKAEKYFREHPEAQLLYGDEDNCEAPWFKPDWSPDLLDSFFYFGSVTAMRRELFQRAAQWMPRLVEAAGSENRAMCYTISDWNAYEKWVHICAGLAGGYRKGSRSIGHIADILFHGESREAQDRFLQHSEFLKTEREALLRDFRDGWIIPGKAGQKRNPVISIVIPSKDQPDVLGKCLRGCALAAQGAADGASIPYEVIIVDNGSSAENRRRIEALAGQEEAGRVGEEAAGMTYLYQPMEFNFSRMCNLGAAEAKGEFLLFLNDDVELCQPGTLTEMAALADRDYTGAVGLKLYYPDSVRIQHAGITNLPMGPVHKLQFMADDRDYYYGANRGKRNVLAVTAACLMVEKTKYLEAGGFSEELRVAFNDVDFCFRLYELGYQNVCVNDRYAYHHESLSRGDDESAEKLERLLQERDKLYERHPQLDGADPYYSVHLNQTGLDTGIRPAYLTAGNKIQKSRGKFFTFSPKRYRPDACLMVRVEDCRDGKILGYCVVIGDNNACYDRMLLLRNTAVSAQIYALQLEGQYRPDLEENMPDQTNVALCGFHVEIEAGEIPPGKYRLGMAVISRVSGVRLTNWSNRSVLLKA